MTADELRKLFPRASDDFIARNSGGGSAANDTRPAAVMERSPRHGALGARKVQKRDTGLFLVRVTAFRVRLLDEDNLCEKYHVDCCRYAGLLPSDAAGQARITVSQEKVRSEGEERVEIALFRSTEPVKQLSLDESSSAQ